MRHLLFWAAVAGMIFAAVSVEFEMEYGAALRRRAEAQIQPANGQLSAVGTPQ